MSYIRNPPVCAYEILTHRSEQFPELSGFSFSFFHTLIFIIFFIKSLSGFPLAKHQYHYLLWLSITSAAILNKYIDSLCLLVYAFLLFSFSPSRSLRCSHQPSQDLKQCREFALKQNMNLKCDFLLNREAVTLTRAC